MESLPGTHVETMHIPIPYARHNRNNLYVESPHWYHANSWNINQLSFKYILECCLFVNFLCRLNNVQCLYSPKKKIIIYVENLHRPHMETMHTPIPYPCHARNNSYVGSPQWYQIRPINHTSAFYVVHYVFCLYVNFLGRLYDF